MIPFSAAGGILRYRGDSMEFSLLSLSTRSFEFRLPKALPLGIGECVSIELHFYRRKADEIHRVQIDNALPKLIEKQRWYTVFSVSPENQGYADEVKSFSEEYLDFVELKTELNESEFAEVIASYPAEQETVFLNRIEDMEKQLFRDIGFQTDGITSIRNVPEWAIFLQSPLRYQNFLELEQEEFLESYWASHFLASNSLVRMKYQWVYFGNENCTKLLPDAKQLKELLTKAKERKLCPVLVFPPLGFQNLRCAEELLPILLDYDGVCECVVNDIGSALFVAEEMLKSGNTNLRQRAGTLWNRQVKDPRKKWIRGNTDGNENELNSENYLNYLREIGVYLFSTDCPAEGLPNASTAVHVPYQRTNLSVLCPVRACMEEGDRGKERKTEGCPRYCEANTLMYPAFLNTVGLFNGIYILDDSSMECVGQLLRKETGAAIQRIVINLP